MSPSFSPTLSVICCYDQNSIIKHNCLIHRHVSVCVKAPLPGSGLRLRAVSSPRAVGSDHAAVDPATQDASTKRVCPVSDSHSHGRSCLIIFLSSPFIAPREILSHQGQGRITCRPVIRVQHFGPLVPRVCHCVVDHSVLLLLWSLLFTRPRLKEGSTITSP